MKKETRLERLTRRIRSSGSSVLYPVINLEDHQFGFLEDLLSDFTATGVAIVQARHKRELDEEGRAKFGRMSNYCAEHDMVLIVNDDPLLAATIGASGAHLGRDDMPLLQARKNFPEGLLGKTCRSLEHCRQAFAEGASYAALGAMFPSFSKPEAPLTGPKELRRARLGVGSDPLLVAIGGINEYNFHTIMQAGADLVAAVTVFLDPVSRARTLEDFRRPTGGFA
jgi:thiamine-phosphate pyrophosphorylase